MVEFNIIGICIRDAGANFIEGSPVFDSKVFKMVIKQALFY